MFFGESSTLMALYQPEAKRACWSYMSPSSDPSGVMSAAKSSGNVDEYYALKGEDVIEALQKIQEIINE